MPPVPPPSSVASSVASVEAGWLRLVNALGIGPRLVATDGHALVMEWAAGTMALEWLRAPGTTAAQARWLVREALAQCRRLDAAAVNKQEMTHPERHLIIVPAAAGLQEEQEEQEGGGAGLRLVMIDFERCGRTAKPKNTTQVAQFLGSKGVRALLCAKGLAPPDVTELRRATQAYKQAPPAQAQAALEDVYCALVGGQGS